MGIFSYFMAALPAIRPALFRRHLCRLLRRNFKTAAQHEMQVRALAQLFTLDSQPGKAGGINIQLLLLYTTQINLAHVIGGLGQLQGALLVGDCLIQNLSAFGKILTGGQCILDVADGAQGHGGILSHGFLLFESADFHLRRECSASVNRCDQSSAESADRILKVGFKLDDVAVDGGDTAVKNDSRQTGGLGFTNPVEGRRHATLGGNHVRPAFQRFQWHADGHRSGQWRETLFARR